MRSWRRSKKALTSLVHNRRGGHCSLGVLFWLVLNPPQLRQAKHLRKAILALLLLEPGPVSRKHNLEACNKSAHWFQISCRYAAAEWILSLSIHAAAIWNLQGKLLGGLDHLYNKLIHRITLLRVDELHPRESHKREVMLALRLLTKGGSSQPIHSRSCFSRAVNRAWGLAPSEGLLPGIRLEVTLCITHTCDDFV